MDPGWFGLVLGLALVATVVAMAWARSRGAAETPPLRVTDVQSGEPRPAHVRRHDRRWERPAPTVEGVDLSGAPTTFEVAAQAHAVAGDGLAVLVLLTTTCRSCAELWAGMDAAVPVLGVPLLAVVAAGTDVQPVTAVAEVAPADVPVVLSSPAWGDYDAPGAPWFVVVDGASGLVRMEGTRRSWGEVRELIAGARGV